MTIMTITSEDLKKAFMEKVNETYKLIEEERELENIKSLYNQCVGIYSIAKRSNIEYVADMEDKLIEIKASIYL